MCPGAVSHEPIEGPMGGCTPRAVYFKLLLSLADLIGSSDLVVSIISQTRPGSMPGKCSVELDGIQAYLG